MDTLEPQGRQVGRKRVYESDAERRLAYLKRHEMRQLNVYVSSEVMELLDGYVARQKADGAGLSKGQVVEKLIRSQLLRKR